MSYGAEGFYPSNPLDVSLGALLVKGDLPTPAWFNEFVTGGGGYYGGPKGIIRMWAYLALIDYGQTFLAWTFNTHRGGEEQALFGLLDHDGTPSWKYAEFKQIASEFSKLQHFGFPRYHKPDVAIAYSFESNIASRPPSSNTARSYFSVGYTEQVESALQPFFEDNIDVAVINIGHSRLDYKLLIVPADYLMDARKRRGDPELRAQRGHGDHDSLLGEGGREQSVVRHAASRPVERCIRNSHVRVLPAEHSSPEISLNGKAEKTSIGFYEVLEPRTAKTMATSSPIRLRRSPAITVNTYGRGRAIYVARSRADVGACSAGTKSSTRPSASRGDQRLPRACTRGWLKGELFT